MVFAGFKTPSPLNGPDGVPRAIVFDFGVVMFRWRPEVLLQQVLPARAVDAASARHWVQQIFQDYGGEWGEFDRGTISVPDLVAGIAARTGLAPAEVQAVVDAAPAELQAKPDSVAWLHRLHEAGWPLHYLSNMPAPFAEHLQRVNTFFNRFESGVFSSHVKRIKPEPGIFAHAAAHFGRAPQQLLLVDDNPANVAAAKGCGWHAILFRDAAQAEAELADYRW